MKPSSLFPWPDHPLAWISYLGSLLGAWVICLGWTASPVALALTGASFSAFLSSDWVSLLMGRTRQGSVTPSKVLAWQGILLVASAGASAAALLWVAPIDRIAWIQVLSAVGCGLILMFVLRQEWVALDGRLVVLTHLLLTSPALLLGFIRWGIWSPEAFKHWVLPACYFSSQALLSVLWFENKEGLNKAPALLALPLLGGALALIAWGQWLQAALLVAFMVRSVVLFSSRTSHNLPGFASVRRLTLELYVWSGLVLGAWLFA